MSASVTATAPPDLQAAADAARNILLATEQRGQELVAPCFDWIRNLRRYSVPEEVIREGVMFLAACCAYNNALREDAAAVERMAEWYANDALTIKGIAEALRKPLATLAHPPTDGIDYLTACQAVEDVIRRSTVGQLRGSSLRNELRPTAHNQLLRMLEERAR